MKSFLFSYFLQTQRIILLTLLFCATTLFAHAQLEGLWLVEKVEVGNEIMTPVARWSKFNKDGSTSSGNGWLQHTVGKWKFNPQSSQLSLTHENGWVDEAGPFTISSLGKESMIWERMEEGQKVKVSWQKIEALPAGPGDLLLGIWDVEKIEKAGKEVSNEVDPENKMWAFMRSDRIFSFQNHPNGLTKGHWLMDGHHPILRLFGDNEKEQWRVSFEKDKMAWRSETEGDDMVITFKRIHHFPPK